MMPGFDGTGPRGHGPGTGGGFGYCPPWMDYGYQNQCRRGGGRGWGRHRGYYGEPRPGDYPHMMNPLHFQSLRPALEDERAYLENIRKNLERQLNEIKIRLDEISQKQAEEVNKES
ncbi:MAG: DUF5320 family protein [Candidatus Xenobiia bacterium LiM19]